MFFSNVIAIIQKELQSYFAFPLAYATAAIFWFVSGFFFIEILIGDRGIVQQIALQQQMGIELGSIDVATEFLNSYLAILGTLSLAIVPIFSMGLYTEERKQGTMELLATSPISNWVVALGKLIAVVMLFIFMLMPSLLAEAIAFSAADPPLPPSLPFVAHLGLLLTIAGLLSIGMFISSLTSSNILAAILTFSIIIFFWLVDLIINNFDSWIGNILQYISPLESYNNLVRGVINFSDLILLFSYIFLGLFLTVQAVELYRLNRR